MSAAIDAQAYDRIHVVVSETASPSEAFAAEEFAAYWQRLTGHAPVHDNACDRHVHVWIGHDALPPELADRVPIDGLGDDGLYIKTLSHDNLAIVGGRQRGTLYGVHEFFERFMGIRWLTPEETYIPQAPQRIPRIDYRFVPPAFYRDISQRTFMTDPGFAVIHRMNGRFVNSQRIGGSGEVPPHLGGKIDYTNGFAGWGHTFFTFIHPDEYFDEHPEYFSEVQGTRQKNPTQLCLTNPDVLRIVTEKTKAMLRAEPQARVVSISQMDWEYYCTCSGCRAIDEREDSPAGSIIHFVNQVASAIEDEFPDCYIDTYAYMYSQSPPKTMRARDNVIVRLCTFNNDFARPVNTRRSERNRRFAEDLKGWSKVAKNLFIYDYLPNFTAFQQPNPNLHTIQPNYRFFTKHGVTGLYAQGNPESPASEFEHLRAYVAAKCMWDPNVDAEAIQDEFIGLYYGEGAPYIRTYIDLITRAVRASGTPLTLFARLDWLDYGTVVRADELFRVALIHVREPKYRDRLLEAYLPVRYAALFCRPRVIWSGTHITLKRPPSLTLDQYWDLLRVHGVTHLNDYPIETMREQWPQAPPRLLEGTLHKLKNRSFEVWVVPEFSGAIIRLRDRAQRMDWLRAYTALATGRNDFHDVILRDDNVVIGDDDVPASFTVIAANSSAIELGATPAPELAIHRHIRLEDDTLRVTTTVENNGADSVRIRAKIHPELAVGRTTHPRLETRHAESWKPRDDTQSFSDGRVQLGAWDAADLTGWRLTQPNGRILEADVDGTFTAVYLQSNTTVQRATVDLITPEIHLQPGESQSWAISLHPPAPER